MKILAAVVIIVGCLMIVLNFGVMFNGHRVDCDGDAMRPGERCGTFMQVNAGHGKTYRQMSRENARDRRVGYAGFPVLLAGVVGLIVVVRRQGW